MSGGYLNRSEIRDHLDEVFVSGTVADPKTQIQQSGIDLTLDKVFKNNVELPFIGSSEWCYLPRGSYWVEFRERAAITDDFGLMLWPRSTLFRFGGTLDCCRGKLPYKREGIIDAQLFVENPYGIRLQRGVRLSQALVCADKMEFAAPHAPVAVSKPLTVDKIFAFRSEGILGIDERNVETEEVAEVTLSRGEGYLMRFAEVIRVGNDEVVFSLGDNPHREIAYGWGTTRPQVSPYTGLRAMGAIADAGYHGQLHACVFSYWPQIIRAGVPLLRVAKHSITPVEDESLYNGKYQATGVSGGEPETVVWDPTLASVL